jgi:hypothetical protein
MHKLTAVIVGLSVPALMALTPSAAQAQVVNLSGSGSGAFEAPGVNNGAVAFAQCALDSGAQTISCSSRVYNIVDLTMGHIHIGGPGTSGPVIIGIPALPVHISGAFGQSWTWTASDFNPNPSTGINSIADLIQACAGGNCYLNWHTTVSPGGALRVQLCPTSRTANTINGLAVCTAQ